jgi:hypothetical protein
MTPPPAALLIILLAAGLTGWAALRLWRKQFSTDPVEFVFVALTLGLLLIGWSGLLLAETGRFSLAALAAIWAAVSATLLALVALRRNPAALAPAGVSRWNRYEALALAGWLVIASFFYLRPHEFIIGGADAGVYVNLGASISQTGSILVRDPLLGALDEPLRGALLRAMPAREAAPFYLLPGFYVTGAPPDLVTPQFFHLHPTWQAVGHALGGLDAELLITPLWGLLGCLAVYMTVRSLWGWRPALLALVALSATALQVWFARYPTAEALTQYLFWTGAWALGQWLAREEPPSLWAFVAGAALGQVFLARVDTYVLLALPVALAVWFTAIRGWRRDALWFFAPFLLLAAHSIIHGLLITRPYFAFSLGSGARTLLRSTGQQIAFAAVVLALIVAALGWLALRGRPERRAWLVERARSVLPLLLRSAAVLIVLLALFAYFVRPELGAARSGNYWFGGGALPVLDRENFARLGWYLSPLGLALGVGGIALMLARELNRRTAFILAAAGFFSVVFIWRIGANPHQIYAMRRYVPQVLPLFTIGAVYLLRWLCAQRPPAGRVVAALLTGGWLISILLSSARFATQVDYRGLAAQISELNAALPSKAVVLFNDPAPVGVADFIGTPLRFLHDRPVFLLRQEPANAEADAGGLAAALADAVRDWRKEGYEVVLLQTDAAQPWPLGEESLGPAAGFALRSQFLENTFEARPEKVLPIEWQIGVRTVQSPEGSP